jgi:hypothetical protein
MVAEAVHRGNKSHSPSIESWQVWMEVNRLEPAWFVMLAVPGQQQDAEQCMYSLSSCVCQLQCGQRSDGGVPSEHVNSAQQLVACMSSHLGKDIHCAINPWVGQDSIGLVGI